MLRLLIILIFTIAATFGAGPALAKASGAFVSTFGFTGPAGIELAANEIAPIEIAQGKPKKYKPYKYKPNKYKSKRFKPGKTLGGQGIPGVTTGLFSDLEKQLTRDFFRNYGGKGKYKGKNKGKSKQMPPGLAKRQTLPPGLAMQIQRNGVLPPGLAKRNLPPGLASRLPALPPGQQRLIVGNDVVLVERTTGLILDVLRGALGR